MKDESLVSRLVVSVTVMLAFLAYVCGVILMPIPLEMKDIINAAGGILGGAFVSVVGYWMGSSAGSSRKDQTINDLSKKE